MKGNIINMLSINNPEMIPNSIIISNGDMFIIVQVTAYSYNSLSSSSIVPEQISQLTMCFDTTLII